MYLQGSYGWGVGKWKGIQRKSLSERFSLQGFVAFHLILWKRVVASRNPEREFDTNPLWHTGDTPKLSFRFKNLENKTKTEFGPWSPEVCGMREVLPLQWLDCSSEWFWHIWGSMTTEKVSTWCALADSAAKTGEGRRTEYWLQWVVKPLHAILGSCRKSWEDLGESWHLAGLTVIQDM